MCPDAATQPTQSLTHLQAQGVCEVAHDVEPSVRQQPRAALCAERAGRMHQRVDRDTDQVLILHALYEGTELCEGRSRAKHQQSTSSKAAKHQQSTSSKAPPPAKLSTQQPLKSHESFTDDNVPPATT